MSNISQTGLNVLQRFKNPEYTGKNRCLPCTVLNTGIAIVLSVAVAFLSIPVAILVFVGSVLAIVFRGYLVPGTPTLVQYLPNRVHDAIGSSHDFDTGQEVDIDVEQALTTAGIVRECEDEDDLCLTDAYREAWNGELELLQDEDVQRIRLAASLSVPAEEIQFEESEGRLDIFVDDIRAGGWQSKAAFLADLGTQQLLPSWLEADWESVSVRDRTQLLVALRTFVDTCPDCGGSVIADEDVLRSCCRDEIISVTTACDDCGAVVFTGTDA